MRRQGADKRDKKYGFRERQLKSKKNSRFRKIR